jgi:DNA-binding NtrC family response regulator
VEDIKLLAAHFMTGIPGADTNVLDDAMLERLAAHSWPGNVRELRNAVERLALGGDPIMAAPRSPSRSGGDPAVVDLDTPFRVQKERLVADFEERYAKALLEYSPENLARAARKAGLDRMAVVKLLQRHGLYKT